MKIFATIFLLIIATTLLQAQTVGIGTSTPNAKALLDVSSTTKGVLFPRMTTTQRSSISGPPEGMLVYDTDKNELFYFDGTVWTSILNNNYWQRLAYDRKRIINLFDSVGIGLFFPVEKLDVNGNIRSRDDIKADGNINFGGKLTNTLATGNASLTPICYGKIDQAGEILAGSGNFTVTEVEIGKYRISCPAITGSRVVLATASFSEKIISATAGNGFATFTVQTASMGIGTLSGLNFMIY